MFKQKFVISFVIAGVCNPYEICRRMCDMYGEAILIKNIYK